MSSGNSHDEHAAASGSETLAVEIPGSPISRHDLDVIRRQITLIRSKGIEPDGIVVSSKRLTVEGLRAFGLPVHLNDDFDLNDGLILVSDLYGPVVFDFEEPDRYA